MRGIAASVVAEGAHWGAIAAGIGGIATAGALFVSLVLLRQQLGEARRARLERYREHASSIAFWVELASVDRAHGSVTIRAHIQNASTRPAMRPAAILGLRADVWANASAADHVDTEESAAQWSWVAIPPGPEVTVVRSLTDLPEPVLRLVQDYEHEVVIGELLFTDASGTDWVRTGRGDLIERRSELWATLISLSVSQRDARLREPTQLRPGLRQRLLYWLMARLR